jgi:glucose dehydrogenase
MRRRICISLLVVLALSAGGFAQRAERSRQSEWLYWGGDQGGMKYTALDEITPQNLSRLELAWQWQHYVRRSRSTARFPDSSKRLR